MKTHRSVNSDELRKKEKSFNFKLWELRKLDKPVVYDSSAIRRWNSYKKNKLVEDLKDLASELKRYGSQIPEVDNFLTRWV